MKRKINLILLLICAIAANAQTEEKTKDFDYGKVENSVYENSFFGFSLALPIEWIVQTKEQTENLAEMGKDLVAGDDENLKAVIKASEINSAYLLTVFQYEVGSPVDYNPSFMLVAENLKMAPGIKTGSDYLFQTKKLLKQSQIQYNNMDEEFEKVSIDNKEFYTMNLDLTYAGLTIYQRYYSTISNGFSLNAIISFVTDEQKDELVKILDSIEFKN